MADSTEIQTFSKEGFSDAAPPALAAPPGSAPEPEFQPYVPASQTGMPEFTLQAVLVGAVLGIVFGASSLYLVLRVGMTVSASIPVAVLSITLFRGVSKLLRTRATTILENNIVQTTGSAGESIAFGVGVTMPALLLVGYEMGLARIMVVSILGGILGILMMIPLRRAFIVQLHGRPGEPGKLLYPEGTACAQVLISGEKGSTSGTTVFVGFGLAFLHKIVTEGMHVLRTTLEWSMRSFFSRAAVVASDCASELLGVGYIIGFRTSAIMMAGAVLGTLVLAPSMDLYAPQTSAGLKAIHGNIKFIGAGCVAAAGIISMCRTLPMIVTSMLGGIGSLRRRGAGDSTRRTDNDMPLGFVLLGSLLLLGALTIFLQGEFGWIGGLLGSLLVLVFGFLFVTVSSRLTGEIGSSSNPISGMTVATLLLTCLIFLALGKRSPLDAVLALSIGGVVCIAASNGGTTSQDLKTGYLLGGTPRWQQWAIIIGALTSAVVIGFILLWFSEAGIVYSVRDLPTVNLKGQLERMPDTEIYQGETFHVWKPKANEYDGVKPGKYLVDSLGRVRYFVDPTITGDLKWAYDYKPVPQSGPEADRLRAVDLKGHQEALKTTVTLADPAGNLKVYHLWKNGKVDEDESEDEDEGEEPAPAATEGAPSIPEVKDIPNGFYLVDDAGHVAYTVEGKRVTMKFPAPKTQVMGIIINGLLQQNLNWTMVLIGVFIAVTLELCGVSSLAFAVGVYVPMQYSAPIFLGGLTRWGIDAWAHRGLAAATRGGTAEQRAAAEVATLAKTESSPAVLLASGLIAGGSLAGVLLAFLEFDAAKPVKELLDQTGRLKGTLLADWRVAVPLAVFFFGGLIAVLALTGIGFLFPQRTPFTPPANVSADREE